MSATRTRRALRIRSAAGEPTDELRQTSVVEQALQVQAMVAAALAHSSDAAIARVCFAVRVPGGREEFIQLFEAFYELGPQTRKEVLDLIDEQGGEDSADIGWRPNSALRQALQIQSMTADALEHATDKWIGRAKSALFADCGGDELRRLVNGFYKLDAERRRCILEVLEIHRDDANELRVVQAFAPSE